MISRALAMLILSATIAQAEESVEVAFDEPLISLHGLFLVGAEVPARSRYGPELAEAAQIFARPALYPARTGFEQSSEDVAGKIEKMFGDLSRPRQGPGTSTPGDSPSTGSRERPSPAGPNRR